MQTLNLNRVNFTTSLEPEFQRQGIENRLLSIQFGESLCASSILALTNSETKHRWNDEDQLDEDFEWLEQAMAEYLPALTDALNAVHQKDYSLDFWRLILSPWLYNALSVLRERWTYLEQLQSANGTSIEISSAAPIQYMRPANISEFNDLCMNDVQFNAQIYSEIAAYLNIPVRHIRIEGGNHPPRTKTRSKIWSKDTLKRIVYSMYYQWHRFTNKDCIVFADHYFDRKLLVNATKPLLPDVVGAFAFRYINHAVEMSGSGNSVELGFNAVSDDKFDRYAADFINRWLPQAHLAFFPKYLGTVQALFPNAKGLFTANANIHDEAFKVWMALMKARNPTFVIATSDHGGCLKAKCTNTYLIENKNSDVHVTWSLPQFRNDLQLPPQLPIWQSGSPNIHPGRHQFLIILNEMPFFPLRMQSSPQSINNLKSIKDIVIFVEGLEQYVRQKLVARPYPGRKWNSAETINVLAADVVIDGVTPLEKLVDRAELIVCTYPQTTVLQCLMASKPFILVYDPKMWTVLSGYDDVLRKCVESGVVFFDHSMAAKHLNNIASDIPGWWSSEPVVVAINALKAMLRISSAASSETAWATSLNKLFGDD